MAEPDARDAVLALLTARAPDATVCPSEVARAVLAPASADAPPSDWRTEMPRIHAAVDQLLEEGRIRLSWKGKTLARRAGPYRIGRAGFGGG